jgi:hypothetical protein
MIQLNRSMIHKWIIDKNVNSKDILEEFTASVISAHKGFNFDEIINQTISQGRKIDEFHVNKGSSITVGVRLLQACFYMYGYSTNLDSGKKIFMPSPMTLNISSTLSEEDKAKNYLVNLFCMQFPHPFDWTPDCFQIYFGRLFVKLLSDSRINNRLYIDECIWFLPFIETINHESYEVLIESILEYRSYNFFTKKELFESIENYDHLFANVTHEINYYFLRFFADCNVFNLVEDRSHNEGKLFKFLHSKTETSTTFRNNAYQSSQKYTGYIELTNIVKVSAKKLDNTFSAFDVPSHIDGIEIFTRENWMTNIYQIEPLKYLSCIDTKVDQNSEIMTIVTEMITASKFGSKDGKEFENSLEPFIKLFKETMNVEILSGAGNTDLLCTMEEQPTALLYNMNLEAKTRGSALEGVLTTRINKHIKKHGSKFCVIVAPRFSRGVFDDIFGNEIVTIRSEEFGNYCYKECRNSINGLADFSSILKIINNNMGTDITNKVRLLTETRYGLPVE